MTRFLLLLAILLPGYLSAQNNLKNIREKSWQTIVYRVTAGDAAQFLKWDSIPLDRFIDAAPALVQQTGLLDEDQLPVGNYVLVSTNEIYVNAELACISRLTAVTVNNKFRLQIDVKKEGFFVKDAKIFVNNREAVYNNESGTWWVNRQKNDEAILRIYAPGDTLFSKLEAKDDVYESIARQRLHHFKRSRLFSVLNWIPAKIKSLFGGNHQKNARIGTGYIVFNQAKYKPLDTVKFKGYVVNKRWKQYKKPVNVYLDYQDRGKSMQQLITSLKPSSGGSYFSSFVLADTLPIDINYNLVFRTPKKKDIIRERFKVEDYVPDEIGSYSFKSSKPVYFRNDTLRFSASASDANGLAVMDASATLLLTTKSVDHFYQDTVFIADTIYTTELKMGADGDTKFNVPADLLPKADVTINATLVFKNSNNELHEETISVEYKYFSREIIVTQEADSIKAIYVENGIPKEGAGGVEMNDDTAIAIRFPCAIKIDPYAEEYTFYSSEENQKNILVEYTRIDNNYQLNFSRVSNKDTAGFILNNPYKIPVYFTVFDGQKIIASGKQSGEQVTWKKLITNRRQLYKVRWQYVWRGEERYGEDNIGLMYKLLNVNITAQPTVFPGQSDSISIDVKDYLGRPAEGVNLTAVSYNNQLKKDIRLPGPPYLAKYKRRKYLERDGFETDGTFTLSERYLLGKNQSWIGKLHLDTMMYYKLLFPEDGFFNTSTLLGGFVPQVSVNVVEKGVPQEIYLLYINRELVYYNGVTDSMQYAFPVMPGYIQVGIRLMNKYIEIDSIFIQPNYKHDISIDISKLPAHSNIQTAPLFWTGAEINLLEHAIIRLDNNYQEKNAFLWQDNRVMKLTGNQLHIVGPIRQNQLRYFDPTNFDIAFMFEPGYRYNISKQVVRLEKQPLFPVTKNQHFLRNYPVPKMKLGDTLLAPPEIFYPPVKEDALRLLAENDFDHRYEPGKASMAKLQITVPKDSVIEYVVMVSKEKESKPFVLKYYTKINNLRPGNYAAYLVTNHFFVAALNDVSPVADGTNCVDAARLPFFANNPVVDSLTAAMRLLAKNKSMKTLPKKEPEKLYVMNDSAIYSNNGATISGNLVDKKGRNAIPFASINVKGYLKAVLSDVAGNFLMTNLKPGKYILVFSAIGYESVEVAVDCKANENIQLNVTLRITLNSLQEVVVIGYGTEKRKSLTGSISMASDAFSFNMLAGKAAGVTVKNAYGFFNEAQGDDVMVRIRGAATVTGSDKVLYVIDGILYDELPKNINISNNATVNVLTGIASTAIYGMRAANGVVVITTDATTFRKDFRDYAVWAPDLYTGKNGRVSFPVSYPDNITGWRTFAIAMDKKGRTGKASFLTQAFKPVVAQLSVPRFLVEGDSAVIIGKSINYTADKYSVTTKFLINEQAVLTQQKQLLPNDADITPQSVIPMNTDTIRTAFTLESTTGFKDGEERKIPVFKKGLEEATGNFWVLQNDTSFSFTTSLHPGEMNLYAQNNTLDMLLEELDQLRKYPYYCMEQTASKLAGLAMEKKIREQLNQPFKGQAEMDKLLQKIQKQQLFDGGWAWWENGKADFYITNYVTQGLLQFRGNPLVEANVRNAFLYLQNQLPFLDRCQLVTALATLSEGKHEMNYTSWIGRVDFDSLPQHYQWLWVKIKQQQQLGYRQPLQKLVDQKINTQLGGIHWGTENYSWYSNETATTTIAYTIIKNERDFKNLEPGIIQYFLEKRRQGHWTNTVESATIISTILPAILERQKDFAKPATIRISGDTNFVISHFPYQLKTDVSSIKNLTIRKDGGGLVYFTAWQKTFNPRPVPVQDKFIISTVFKKNGREVPTVKTGENVTLVITIDALKDAEYVMIQVPIPAGCIYAEKKNDDWGVHREFYKNTVVLFADALPKGVHRFEIELEPRYTGHYTLNPAKVELMYYPIFFGSNDMKKVELVK